MVRYQISTTINMSSTPNFALDALTSLIGGVGMASTNALAASVNAMEAILNRAIQDAAFTTTYSSVMQVVLNGISMPIMQIANSAVMNTILLGQSSGTLTVTGDSTVSAAVTTSAVAVITPENAAQARAVSLGYVDNTLRIDSDAFSEGYVYGAVSNAFNFAMLNECVTQTKLQNIAILEHITEGVAEVKALVLDIAVMVEIAGIWRDPVLDELGMIHHL